MAIDIPVPWLFILASAFICMINAFVFPEIFPETATTRLFLLLTSVSFCLWATWRSLIYPSWFSPLRHLPAPKGGLPFIGFAPKLFGAPLGDVFLRFLNEVPNEGLIRIPTVMGINRLLLADAQSLAEVLVQKSYDYQKPSEIRNFLRIILGDGLVIVEGNEHKFQRKHVSPAFSFRHIKELYPKFWSKAVALSRCIAAEIQDNPEYTTENKASHPQSVVEVNHWANKVTMDIIGVAGLGREFNALQNADDELIRNYEEILEPSTEKAMFFAANLVFPQRLIKMLPWKINVRLQATTTRLRNICHQLVRDQKELVKTQQEDHSDILSLLIKSNDFADDMLVDQLLTFLAAGHETTSSAFTWATHLLAKYPEVQSRLREEIRANLPSPSALQDPTTDLAGTLENLPYLNAVCNETLRLYPTVPVTIRIATRPTTIHSQHIPKGTRIYIAPWAINRSPDHWGPDANEYRPERWIGPDTGRSNNSGGVSSNYSNLTFLHGPRSCIGERFAKSELKALIAVFCGTFQMSMADPNEVPIPYGAITTKPKNGMRLRLQVLDGW